MLSMGTQTDDVLIEHFLTNYPIDAVRIIENLNFDDIVKLLDTMPDYLATRIVSHLNIITSVNYLQMINIQKAAVIVDNLPLELVSTMIRSMPKDFRGLLLDSLSQKTSSFLSKTLSYPEGTVGAIMDPFVHTLYEDNTVAEALKFLKKQAKKDLYYIYILSRDQKLAGVLSIGELFRLKSDQLLSSVMNNKVIKILANVKYELILTHPGWQDLHVLPVVDDNNIFQGLIRYKVLRRLEEKGEKDRLPQNLIAASSALGELYRLGMASLIRGAADIYRKPDTKI
jgi:magnesium transporter